MNHLTNFVYTFTHSHTQIKLVSGKLMGEIATRFPKNLFTSELELRLVYLICILGI